MALSPLPECKVRHIFFLYRTEGSSRNSVIRLFTKLEEHGYRCGGHEQDFVIGKSYLYNLESCIRESLVVIPWICKEFLQSPYCMKDLEVACHCYDQGIMVMPLLYKITQDLIPDIVKQMVCLDVSGGEASWITRLLDSLSRHIKPIKTLLTAQQEADGLIRQFKRMSSKGKLLFAIRFSMENMIETLQMINSLPTTDVFEIFGIELKQDLNCVHISQTYSASGDLERECHMCVLLSFNTNNISAFDQSVIAILSHTCATHLGAISGNSQMHKKVSSVFEYIFSRANSDKEEKYLHFCYENNYFMGNSYNLLITTNLMVYDEFGKLIRRSCLGLECVK